VPGPEPEGVLVMRGDLENWGLRADQTAAEIEEYLGGDDE
jgi:hypothetical protein